MGMTVCQHTLAEFRPAFTVHKHQTIWPSETEKEHTVTSVDSYESLGNASDTRTVHVTSSESDSDNNDGGGSSNFQAKGDSPVQYDGSGYDSSSSSSFEGFTSQDINN